MHVSGTRPPDGSGGEWLVTEVEQNPLILARHLRFPLEPAVGQSPCFVSWMVANRYGVVMNADDTYGFDLVFSVAGDRLDETELLDRLFEAGREHAVICLEAPSRSSAAGPEP
jgi:hypothetical protein